MKTNAMTIWAVGASAIALVLAGILIGQSLDLREKVAVGPTATEPGGEPLVDRFVVPAWLQDAPKEWRSPYRGEDHGFAILFDYDRKELLVENCNHAGFFDRKKNLPVKRNKFKCDRLLTSTLIEFNEAGVLVQRKDGSELQVDAKTANTGGVPVLDLEFDGYAMDLVPGGRNDMLQDIVNTPEMDAQKALMFAFNEQQIRQERARLAAANEEGVPRFALSKAALKELEAERQAELSAKTGL